MGSSLLLLVFALVVTVGCERPEITRATPGSTPNVPATQAPPAPVMPTTAVTTQDDTSYSIDRITLATGVDENGEPESETSVIPEDAERFFLCIHVENVEPGAQFRAYWLEGDQIIGQSDRISTNTEGGLTWVALEYRPISELKPAASYAVELLINDERIDRYLFRVGTGNHEDSIAEAAFASGFDRGGIPIGVQTRFPATTDELTFRVRVSSRVDPSPMSFTTLWFRESTQIAQLSPDRPDTVVANPSPAATPTIDPRRLSFSYVPSGPLVPGNYRVVLLLNGNEVRSVPFVVTATTASGALDPKPASTSTEGDGAESESNATVSEIMVTGDVDPDTNEPVNGRVYVWQDDEGTSVELWVAMYVYDLQVGDVVEVMIWRDNQLFASDRLPATEVSEGWIAHPFDFAVPQQREGSSDYLTVVLINGNRLLEAAFEMVPIPE